MNGAVMQHRVAVPGGAIAVGERGSGPPVVFVHGGTSTAAADWDVLEPWLDGFTVITFDHRGHGRSRGFDEGIGMDRFGLDLLHVMRFLGLPSAAFVGFSVGANTLLRLVPRRPGLARALVLIGSGLRGRPERVEPITTGPWLEALIGLEHDEGADDDHWQRIRHALAHDWADRHDFTAEQGARITCPTLVLHGAEDRIEPPVDARGVHDRIPGSRLTFVDGAGHMAQVDRPDVVGPLVADFLHEVLDRSPAARLEPPGVAA